MSERAPQQTPKITDAPPQHVCVQHDDPNGHVQIMLDGPRQISIIDPQNVQAGVPPVVGVDIWVSHTMHPPGLLMNMESTKPFSGSFNCEVPLTVPYQNLRMCFFLGHLAQEGLRMVGCSA